MDSDFGAQLRDGIKTVAAQGDCPESEWPYRVAKLRVKPSLKSYADAVIYRPFQYQRVAGDLNQMKDALLRVTPLSSGSSFMSAS